MCLIVVAFNRHPDYPLIIAANRDEFYIRPTLPAAFQNTTPPILSGTDLQAGGTWLGLTREGRFAAVTNVRRPGEQNENRRSRGLLVRDFLLSSVSTAEFADELSRSADEYNGYNLLFGTSAELFWFSNRDGAPRELSSGIHGVSNARFDTPWPKVTKTRAALESLLENGRPILAEDLLVLLSDESPASEGELPDTGVGKELELFLSPVCIRGDKYGTRSSTVVLIDRQDRILFLEKTLGAGGDPPVTVRWEWTIGGKPGRSVSQATERFDQVSDISRTGG